jgi:hypothetical protein
MKNQYSLALFGATGSCGKEFLKLALANHHKVKALVRNPKNLSISNPNLTIIQGDFNNYVAISEVVENSDIIICMAGSLQSPEKDLMFNFVKTLHLIMLEKRVTNLTYQAGALCYLPNSSKNIVVRLLRNTIGKITGTETALADHDRVLDYIQSRMTPIGLKIIVTLPGALGLTSGQSQRDLQIQKGMKFKSSRFIDVAKFTLENIDNSDLQGQYVYIA